MNEADQSIPAPPEYEPPSPPVFTPPSFDAPPVPEHPDPAVRRKSRAKAFDTVVAQGRAATPDGIEDARAVKRMSIEEMNAADPADLKARFYSAPYDDRGGFTRFLDLLDAPRNFILSHAAPAIERKKREAGETGTGGQGKVYFSDVLEEMGVENRVVKGILGFVGDVALDPLTYVGGAGLGAKLVSGTGKVVELTAAGRRVGNATAKLAARGGKAGGEYGELFAAFGHTPESIAARKAAGATTAQIEAELTKIVYGDTAGRLRRGAALGLGMDIKGKGGSIVESLEKTLTATDAPELIRQQKAARAIIEKYGRASAPGVGLARNAAGKLGLTRYGPGEEAAKAGSYIAHIPFTSYGLFVPAFTDQARQSMTTLLKARSGLASQEIVDAVRGVEGGKSDVAFGARMHAEAQAAVTRADDYIKAQSAEAAEDGEDALSVTKDLIAKEHEDALAKADQIRKFIYAGDPYSLTREAGYESLRPAAKENKVTSTADLMYLAQKEQEIRASVMASRARLGDTQEIINTRNAILSPLKAAAAAEAEAKVAAEEAARLGQPNLFVADAVGKAGDTVDAARKAREAAIQAVRDKAAAALAYLEHNAPLAANPTKKAMAAKNLARFHELMEETRKVNPEAVKAIREAAEVQRKAVSKAAMPDIEAALDNLKKVSKESRDTSLVELGEKLTAESMARRIKALTPEQQALANMDELDADTLGLLADRLHNEMTAKQALAAAMRSPIVEAARPSDNTALARVAMNLMGLDADTHGFSAFTPFRSAIRAVLGSFPDAGNYLVGKVDAMDEFLRKGVGIGASSGEINRVRKMVQNTDPAVAKIMQAHVFNAIVKPTLAAVEKAGLPPVMMDWAQHVVYTIMAFKRNAANIAADAWHIGEHDAAILKEARAGGLGKAWTDLEKIADDAIGMLDKAAEADKKVGALDSTRAGYLPDRLTKEGQMARKEIRFGDRATKEAASADWFNSPKASTKAHFQSGGELLEDGTRAPIRDHNLYRFEYDFFKSLPEEVIKKLDGGPNANVADYYRKMKEVVANYDALEPEIRMASGAFKQVTPYTKNMDSARFGIVNPGVSMPRGYFEQSAAELVAARLGASEMAHSQAMVREVLDGLSDGVEHLELAAGIQRKTAGVSDQVKMASGAWGTIQRNTDGVLVLDVNGNRVRTLKDGAKIGNALNMFGAGLFDADHMHRVYPEKVAEAIERIAEVMGEPGKLLGIYDEAIRIWKSFTLMHPSWTVGDIFGNMVQTLAMGVTPAAWLKATKRAAQLALSKDDPERLSALRMVINGSELSGEEAIVASGGVARGHVHGVPLVSMVGDGTYLPTQAHSMFNRKTLKDPVGQLKEHLVDMSGRAAIMANATIDGQSVKPNKFVRGAKYGKNMLLDEGFIRHAAAPFFALNGKVNDWMRLTNWIALQEMGNDAVGATNKVLEGMFDFEDLTRFEKTWARRMIPFYTWLKSSSVYGLNKLFTDPKYVTLAPNAHRAVEESLYGDNAVPMHLRPQWMRDQMAVQIGADPESRYSFNVGTLIPQEGAVNIGAALASPIIGAEGLKELATYVGFGAAFPVRMALDLAAGREAYSGREISYSPDEGDLSVSEYMLNQVRPLRELGLTGIRKGPLTQAAEVGPGALAARVLVGGRAQPFSDERIKQAKVKEYKTRITNIKRRIQIASRDKNVSASRASRARLMSVYSEMRKNGYQADVPKWANTQLDTILTR